MSRFGHSIRQQTLEVEVASEALALQLQPRLGDFNRERLLPVIERVLDELAVPGRRIRIARLEVDLGTVPLSSFEQVSEARLYLELRRAVEKALRELEARPTEENRSQPEEVSRQELLEHYLLQGTLPFWASEPSAFSLDVFFQELLQADPEGLVRLLQRHGHLSPVLERLVAQLETPRLERLLGLLDPEHAALVIDYIANLNKLHEVRPVLPLSDRAFSRVLWSLALGSRLQDPGTQFNRKSSVKSLLEGIAESRGLDYRDILTTLRMGLEQMQQRHPLRSSLPAIIEELVRESDLEFVEEPPPGDTEEESAEASPALRRYEQVDALRYYVRHGVLPSSMALRAPELTVEHLLAVLPELPGSLLRSVFPRGQPQEQLPALLRAVRGMPEKSLEQLLHRLLPGLRDADSPLRAALEDAAARAQDRSTFFAQVLSAALEERPVDLEALTAPHVASRVQEPVLPGSLEDWEAHALEATLVNRLRYGEQVSDAGPTPAELLTALISAHPRDARRFLRALRNAGTLGNALIQELPAPLFDRVIELLCPDEAATLQALMRTCTELAAPYLQSSEAVLRQTLFHQALRLEEGRPLDEDAFVQVLREVFRASPPEPVRASLSRALALGAARDRLPAAHVEALEQAIASETPLVSDALFAFLLGERPPAAAHDGSPLSEDSLQHMARRLLEESPEKVQAFLRKHLADPRRRERWVKLLPEAGLARLCQLLEPRKHRALLEAAEVLADAWHSVAPSGQPALRGRSAFWGFVLEFLHQSSSAHRTVERLTRAFFDHFAGRFRSTLPGAAESEAVGERLLKRASELAQTERQARLGSALRRDRSVLVRRWAPSPHPRSGSGPLVQAARPRSGSANQNTAFKLGGKAGEQEIKDAIYINNAGLVLTNPFLPQFFQGLDMLRQQDDGKALRWKDPETLSRAVHLLQYLVDGQSGAPEPTLVLNKVLCGVAPSTPIEREISLTDNELALCEQLLKAVIGNWKAISNTSIAGLRETFLQRKGRLHLGSEGWKLLVQRKTLDVLVDQLPWSISIVSHRWMPQPIYVTW